MNRIQLNQFFYLDEYIPPEIYSVRGEKAKRLLNIRLLQADFFLRQNLGACIINNWLNYKGGYKWKNSGLRSFDCMEGAKWSDHKYGNASDKKFLQRTPQEVFDFIMANEKYLIENQLITIVENPKFTAPDNKWGWIHTSCAFTGLDHIQIVDP